MENRLNICNHIFAGNCPIEQGIYEKVTGEITQTCYYRYVHLSEIYKLVSAVYAITDSDNKILRIGATHDVYGFFNTEVTYEPIFSVSSLFMDDDLRGVDEIDNRPFYLYLIITNSMDQAVEVLNDIHDKLPEDQKDLVDLEPYY